MHIIILTFCLKSKYLIPRKYDCFQFIVSLVNKHLIVQPKRMKQKNIRNIKLETFKYYRD